MNNLFVFATRFENQLSNKIPTDNILIAGIGKLNSAVNLIYKLKDQEFDAIINLGICGSVLDSIKPMTLCTIEKTIEGDLDPLIKRKPIELPIFQNNGFEKFTIVTQDHAILNESGRKHVLSKGGQLADMECFALAFTAKKFNIPFYSFKIVSDNADEFAVKNIKDVILNASKILCEKIEKLTEGLLQ